MILDSRAWRALGVLTFIIGGCFVAVAAAGNTTQSFWYVVGSLALIPVGMLWAWKPSIAGPLSVGPLIASAALAISLRGWWLGVTLAWLIAALAFVVTGFYGNHRWKTPLVVSLAFVAAALGTGRLFTHKMSIRTYQLDVAADGNAPWGSVGPTFSDGTSPIVLYRPIGWGYCYEAFQSQELYERLVAKGRDKVPVQFNVFSDFGREHSWSVRSVDGVLLDTGDHVVKDAWRFGAEVLTSGHDGGDECW